jgi:hypothetical protein
MLIPDLRPLVRANLAVRRMPPQSAAPSRPAGLRRRGYSCSARFCAGRTGGRRVLFRLTSSNCRGIYLYVHAFAAKLRSSDASTVRSRRLWSGVLGFLPKGGGIVGGIGDKRLSKVWRFPRTADNRSISKPSIEACVSAPLELVPRSGYKSRSTRSFPGPGKRGLSLFCVLQAEVRRVLARFRRSTRMPMKARSNLLRQATVACSRSAMRTRTMRESLAALTVAPRSCPLAER